MAMLSQVVLPSDAQEDSSPITCLWASELSLQLVVPMPMMTPEVFGPLTFVWEWKGGEEETDHTWLCYGLSVVF